MPRSQTEHLKDWLQITAIFIAAIWAIYTFYFEKILAPSKYPTFLTLNSEISKVSENENYALYRVKITVLNKSKVRESLLASWYEVDAFSLLIDTTITDKRYIQILDSNWGNYIRFPRYNYYDYSNYKVVNSGKILNEGLWLNPDQEFTEEFVTLLPNNKYEELSLTLNAITAKDNAGMHVHWFDNPDGSANPIVIAGENNKDTIHMSDFNRKKKKQVSSYFTKYDLSYTFNDNEYSLGLKKAK